MPGLDDKRLVERRQVARERHQQREQRWEQKRLGDLQAQEGPGGWKVSLLRCMRWRGAARALAADAGTHAAAALGSKQVARENPNAGEAVEPKKSGTAEVVVGAVREREESLVAAVGLALSDLLGRLVLDEVGRRWLRVERDLAQTWRVGRNPGLQISLLPP